MQKGVEEFLINRRQLLGASVAGLGVGEWSNGAFAQTDYPTSLIKAIVPFSAGSTTDTVGRIVLHELGVLFGQTIIVENRGGAGGWSQHCQQSGCRQLYHSHKWGGTFGRPGDVSQYQL
jgi:hypothetical protein